MPRQTKKPWNADLRMPGLDGEPPSPPPKPTPITGAAYGGLTTAGFMPPLPDYHVVEVLPDGTRVTLMAGDHPWVGSARGAILEAQRLTRETGRPHEAAEVDSAQPSAAPTEQG